MAGAVQRQDCPGFVAQVQRIAGRRDAPERRTVAGWQRPHRLEPTIRREAEHAAALPVGHVQAIMAAHREAAEPEVIRAERPGPQYGERLRLVGSGARHTQPVRIVERARRAEPGTGRTLQAGEAGTQLRPQAAVASEDTDDRRGRIRRVERAMRIHREIIGRKGERMRGAAPCDERQRSEAWQQGRGDGTAQQRRTEHQPEPERRREDQRYPAQAPLQTWRARERHWLAEDAPAQACPEHRRADPAQWMQYRVRP